MLNDSLKSGLLAGLIVGGLALNGCGSSNAPDQRRVTSNPFAPAESNRSSSRAPSIQSAQPSRPAVSEGKKVDSPKVTKQEMEEPKAQPQTSKTDIIAEASKLTLDSKNPGVAVIINGLNDQISEALPVLQKTLVPDSAPASPQLEHRVIDNQLLLVLRPAPADLFAFAQKLKFGTLKEIDLQKRVITIETQLPKLVAFSQDTGNEDSTMDSDVKVSANSNSLKNMKPETPAPSVSSDPEKKTPTKSNIGTDRDLKPRPGEDTIDWALRVIAGSSSFAHDTACKKLAKMKPDDENLQRVSSVLAETLPLAKEGFRMKEHINAMSVWYTDSATLAFAKLLEDENSFLVRKEIIELLPTMHTETTAEVLAGRLANRKDKREVRRSLQFMGEIAEKPIIQLLNDPDSSLRIEACNLLNSIGTEAAVVALKQRLETEDNTLVKQQMTETQAMIEKKLATKGN